MQLPVVDIVEVGAGGGSIAWCDGAGSRIHVGATQSDGGRSLWGAGLPITAMGQASRW